MIQGLAGFLVVMPAHPGQHNPLYLMQGLVRMVQGCSWQVKSLLGPHARCACLEMFHLSLPDLICVPIDLQERIGQQQKIFISIIQAAAALAQERLPFHVRGIDSNDILYAAHNGFGTQLSTITHNVLRGLLPDISSSKILLIDS